LDTYKLPYTLLAEADIPTRHIVQLANPASQDTFLTRPVDAAQVD